MRKKTVLLIGLLFVSTVFAQPRHNVKHKKKARAERMWKKEKNDFRKAGHRERMQNLMTLRMTEELDLTTEQAEKFFPRLKEHREVMDKIDSELLEVTKSFNEKVGKDQKISDKEIDDISDKIQNLEMQKIDERARHFKELKGILKNEQRAKLMTFKHRFKRDVEKRLRVKKEKLEQQRSKLDELKVK